MPSSFVKPRTRLLPPSGPTHPFVRTIEVLLTTVSGRPLRVRFLVDSGADISLVPRALCDRLGMNWETGTPMLLHGISPKAECDVNARVHDVEVLVPDIGVALTVPICFADGDASFLAGREGFFDSFRIEFDKARLLTKFDLVDEPQA